VTVIVTNVGADFTSLGSFGSAEGFGANLVSSMDRSFLLRKAVNKDSVQARARPDIALLRRTAWR
jgi:hypothetical protein